MQSMSKCNDCCHSYPETSSTAQLHMPPISLTGGSLLLILLLLFAGLCNPSAAPVNDLLHQTSQGRVKSRSRLNGNAVCLIMCGCFRVVPCAGLINFTYFQLWQPILPYEAAGHDHGEKKEDNHAQRSPFHLHLFGFL